MKYTRLGQHFLKNKAAIRLIIDTLNLRQGDTVIEVGPGHGELTKPLFEDMRALDGKLICIERDAVLLNQIAQDIRYPNLVLKQGDALALLPELITAFKQQKTPYKIVGNIPYYITGHLLRILGEVNPKPEISVFTIQREVAERITAVPPKMNLLAATSQFWAKITIISFLSHRDFSPQPKVDSAIISCTPRVRDPLASYPHYFFLVRAAFKQPRKTLLNNLAAAFPQKTREELTTFISSADIDPLCRPQNLSVEHLKKLSKIVYNGNI